MKILRLVIVALILATSVKAQECDVENEYCRDIPEIYSWQLHEDVQGRWKGTLRRADLQCLLKGKPARRIPIKFKIKELHPWTYGSTNFMLLKFDEPESGRIKGAQLPHGNLFLFSRSKRVTSACYNEQSWTLRYDGNRSGLLAHKVDAYCLGIKVCSALYGTSFP